MSLLALVLRSISGSSFRSTMVLLCALFISGFALSTTLIISGAQESLRISRARLGADLVVVPEGAESRVEGALLSGKPTSVWMPADDLRKIASVEGIVAASPQLYLASLSNASCCAISELFMIAFDPSTDFTVQPWLEETPRGALELGEGIGGYYVFVPPGEEYIKLYGYPITLKGGLAPTGTGLDQTLFFTFDTAREMSRVSLTEAVKPLDLPTDSISTVMVRVAPGEDLGTVTSRIAQSVPGVTVISSSGLFQSVQKQLASLSAATLVVLGLTLGLSVSLLALVFSLAVHERRRELGVLRALGATHRDLLEITLLEAGLLAVQGGLVGVAVAALGTVLFHNLLVASLAVPFLLPSPLALLEMVVGGLALAVASVVLAALVPALWISHQEPALAMRE